MNKVVLVTGGTKGIGLATCKMLYNEGFRVFACSSQDCNIERARSEYANITFLKCDVSKGEEVSQLFASIGRVDVLVNNAGVLKVGPFTSLSLDDMRRMMDVNFWGAINCSRAALCNNTSELRIVNVLSSSIEGGRKGQGLYVASKAALAGAMMSLRLEVGDQITIVDIKPRRTLTDMRLDNFPNEDHEDCLEPQCVASMILNACLDKEERW
jgi:3-oxoacyl-[acyl-carrier protein] reductase